MFFLGTKYNTVSLYSSAFGNQSLKLMRPEGLNRTWAKKLAKGENGDQNIRFSVDRLHEGKETISKSSCHK